MSLNWSQRNVLATSLELLERSLDEIERLLDSPPAGLTYAIEVDFRPATARQIRERCRDIRGEIAEIVTAFELSQRRWDGRRMIDAEMSAAWSNLEELRLPGLRRYGAVDPALTETLVPRLERLINLVLALRQLAFEREER